MKPMAKKPSLGEVAIKGDPLDMEVDVDDSDGTYDAAVDEFLDAIGVSEDSREAARDAFKAAVMSCK